MTRNHTLGGELLPPRRARGSGGDTTELPSEARKGFRGRERGMQPGRGGARGAWLPRTGKASLAPGHTPRPTAEGVPQACKASAGCPRPHPRPAPVPTHARHTVALNESSPDGKERNTATPPSMALLRCVFHKLKARPPPAKGSGLASPQWSAPSPSHPGDARAAVVCVAQARATPCSSLASPFFFLSITQLKEKALP